MARFNKENKTRKQQPKWSVTQGKAKTRKTRKTQLETISSDTLFVGCIDVHAVSRELLYEHLETILSRNYENTEGLILGIRFVCHERTVKFRGFALVMMRDTKTAERVIPYFDKTELEGKALQVSFARSGSMTLEDSDFIPGHKDDKQSKRVRFQKSSKLVDVRYFDCNPKERVNQQRAGCAIS